METYTTLKGQVLDLTGLTESEKGYLEYCLAAYREGTSWNDFSNVVTGPGNLLLTSTGGRITQSVWSHPLFQTLRDLEDRLGIQQGEITPDPEDNLDSDPFTDHWIMAQEAANKKGVTLMGLHGAIRRGELIARPIKPGGKRLMVSANSLSHWQPDRIRQQARKRPNSFNNIRFLTQRHAITAPRSDVVSPPPAPSCSPGPSELLRCAGR